MNIQSIISGTWLLSMVAAMGVGVAAAQTTTITGVAGGSDSWHDPNNWDAGVPTGAIDAAVGGGIQATVNNPATATYSGSLTLHANSILTMDSAVGSHNAVEGASSIIMHAGSEIQVNMNVGVSFPPITLVGDAMLTSLFGASDHETDDFAAITGAYTLTFYQFNNHTINLNTANGFSNLIADTKDRWNLRGRAAGSLGTGNITINPRSDGRSASLYIDAPDAMADSATLTLNGSTGQGGYTGDGTMYVVMNASDTIAGLVVWGVPQAPGSYTNTEPWLTGPGTLTVQPDSGTPYCFGDSTGGACPCSGYGGLGEGCANTGGTGVLLVGAGSAALSNDTFRLEVTGAPGDKPGLILRGIEQVNGGIGVQAGDGLLCTTGQTARSQVQVTSAGSTTFTDFQGQPFGQSSYGGGVPTNYQFWYRDPSNMCSGAGFNFSNAWTVVWLP